MELTQNIRGTLKKLGLEEKVLLGIQANWYPAADPDSNNCADFRNWISSLDFVSPSMYGDWSKLSEGINQPPNHIEEILKRLSREEKSGCQIPEFRTKPLGFGEVGTGGNLSHSERWDPPQPKDKKRWMADRRILYKNLINWLRTFTEAQGPSINLWTSSVFDPTGINTSLKAMPDSKIAKMVKDYKNWRCQGYR